MVVSVILPVYNGSRTLIGTIEEVKKFSKKFPNFEFIFVNDGSTDNSLRILHSHLIFPKTKNIKLISYNRNKGKGYAVKKGVLASKGNYICFMDSDLAYSLDYLHDLIKYLERYDVVLGSRTFAKEENRRRIKLNRQIPGIVYNKISRILLNHPYLDTQAGIKGFRSSAARKLFAQQKIKRFAFDTELIFLSLKYNFRIKEMPIIVSRPETYNSSTVNIIKDSIVMFFSLLKIKYSELAKKYEK